MNKRDVRLPSPAEMEILDLLSSKEMYGLQMVKSSKRLTRGGIYVMLNRMEEKGLVSSRVKESDSSCGRRVYKITGQGRRAYALRSAAEAAYDALPVIA